MNIKEQLNLQNQYNADVADPVIAKAEPKKRKIATLEAPKKAAK